MLRWREPGLGTGGRADASTEVQGEGMARRVQGHLIGELQGEVRGAVLLPAGLHVCVSDRNH